VPIFLNLEIIVNGGTSLFTSVIIYFLVVFGDITNKVIYFGVNGVTIFQGLKTGVIIQLDSKHCPFCRDSLYGTPM
jgi:hypothetical protein